jgi:hypothetical protein
MARSLLPVLVLVDLRTGCRMAKEEEIQLLGKNEGGLRTIVYIVDVT